MGSMSLMHWVVVALLLAIFLYPAARILQRAGFSGWWCVLCFVPFLGVVGLWVFAFVRWPAMAAEPMKRAA
jgi:uncharacterized membrane protein YhaH (DUF805 family)